jgi:hypothetical protein
MLWLTYAFSGTVLTLIVAAIPIKYLTRTITEPYFVSWKTVKVVNLIAIVFIISLLLGLFSKEYDPYSPYGGKNPLEVTIISPKNLLVGQHLMLQIGVKNVSEMPIKFVRHLMVLCFKDFIKISIKFVSNDVAVSQFCNEARSMKTKWNQMTSVSWNLIKQSIFCWMAFF